MPSRRRNLNARYGEAAPAGPAGEAAAGGLDYRQAGVDIGAGEALARAILPLARRTLRPGAGAPGGFGGSFDLRAAGFRDPVLVSGADGVGTKLKLAIDAGILDTVGIDCVAMCANDVAVHGAEPLFFLDYLAMAPLDAARGAGIVAGIAEGCRRAGCALIGGESAEMPGLYAAGDFDLAGFCVGAVERGRMLPAPSMAAGDVLLGLASSGVHANGFSLIRRLLAERGLGPEDEAPFLPGTSLGRALLEPARIYARSCLAAAAAGGVKGFAHITGGGIAGNLCRVLPAGLMARIRAGSWPLPPVFAWLARGRPPVAAAEMARVFNCGIGMVAVVAAERAEAIAALLAERGEQVAAIGALAACEGGPRVAIDGLEEGWLAG